MVNPERSWEMFMLCSGTDWSQLPRAGGWEDQDDGFLHDVGVISRRLAYLRAAKTEKEEKTKTIRERLGIAR